MLHAALLRSPYAHARIRSIDVTAARAVPGVYRRGHERRPRLVRPVLRPRLPRPPHPRHRRGALRGRAGGGGGRRGRGRGPRGARADRRRLRAAHRRHHDRGGAGIRRAARPHGRAPGRPLRRSLDPQARRGHQRLPSVPPRTGAWRRRLRRGRPGPRGQLQLPARAALFHGAPLRAGRVGRGGRPHRLGLHAESVLRAGRARRDVPRAAPPDSHRRAAPRRGLRRQDLREDRAHHERARAHGAAPGAAGHLRGGRLPHRAPLRCPRARQARIEARRPALGRGVQRRLRRGRLRRHRAAHHPEGHLYRHRPVPRRPRRAVEPGRLHEHDAGRRLPRLRRASARLGLRVAARRRGPSASIWIPSSCAGRTSSPTARNSRPARPPSTASSRRAWRARRRRFAGPRRPRPIGDAGSR